MSNCLCYLATMCVLRNLTQGKVCYNAPADDMFQAIWLAGSRIIHMYAQSTCTQQVHVPLLNQLCHSVCMCTHCVVGTCLSTPSTHLAFHRWCNNFLFHLNSMSVYSISSSYTPTLQTLVSVCSNHVHMGHSGTIVKCTDWSDIIVHVLFYCAHEVSI